MVFDDFLSLQYPISNVLTLIITIFAYCASIVGDILDRLVAMLNSMLRSGNGAGIQLTRMDVFVHNCMSKLYCPMVRASGRMGCCPIHIYKTRSARLACSDIAGDLHLHYDAKAARSP